MGVFLMSDKRSIVETQPLARCNAGGYATSFAFWNPTDIYGDGRLGSHGGSGLSGFGGSLRVGELRPGQQGPRHALKLTVYGAAVLYKCSTRADCFRWPAATADSVALSVYGSVNNNMNKEMKMGALLAIPGSATVSSLGLETEPGKQLFWTLQNYGAYIVDIGAPGVLFSAEDGPAGSKTAEFQADYGYAFVQKVYSPNAWLRDIQRLAKALMVVTNNTATSIGGGGTPRQPLAAPIAP